MQVGVTGAGVAVGLGVRVGARVAQFSQIEHLRWLAAALASGAAIAEARLAMVAAYVPLHSLPGAGSLLERSWSDAITEVLTQQVREPAEERILRGAIPVLTEVDDDVSRKVRQQYEENPYPRWAQADPPARHDRGYQ